MTIHSGVFVSTNGEVGAVMGTPSKDALLFAPSKKSTSQIVREQRAAQRRNSQLIRERFAAATKR